MWCAPAAYEADPTLPRVPWDHAAYLAPSAGTARLRFGVLRADGWFDAAPALARALEETVQAVRRAGHEVIEVPAEVVCGAEAAACYVAIASADGGMRGFVEALEGEALQKYAIRGTEDDWAAALPSSKAGPPKTLSVKGEARDRGDKKGGKGGSSGGKGGGSKGGGSGKGGGGSGKGGGDRKPKRQKQ